MAAPLALVQRVRGALPDQSKFPSRLHAERPAAILGLALGVSFTVCFLTGLASHLVQHPVPWFDWPARPAGLYRVTQGIHVTTGIASIPLLLGKLWVVYPHFWARPAVRGITSAVERLLILPLVAGGLFLLFTGVLNIAYWYEPFGFFFPAAHYWAAWITIGALVVHIGAKVTITRRALSRATGAEPEPPGEGLSRRGLLLTVGATAGILVAATVGQTANVFRAVSVLAPRRPDRGPQGYPVNKAASQAGIDEVAARSPDWRLTVDGQVKAPLSLSLDELRSMPLHEATLPVACVEGWSFSARWRGVRVRDLLARADAEPGADVRIESMQAGGRYRTSPLNAGQAADRDTLLALELDGEPLALDHGYPVRLIAPNRPGVQQTKWVDTVVVG